MTFTRALITAWLTSEFVEANQRLHGGELIGTLIVVSLIAWVIWSFTSDPIGPAVTKALEDLRRKYRG